MPKGGAEREILSHLFVTVPYHLFRAQNFMRLFATMHYFSSKAGGVATEEQ